MFRLRMFLPRESERTGGQVEVPGRVRTGGDAGAGARGQRGVQRSRACRDSRDERPRCGDRFGVRHPSRLENKGLVESVAEPREEAKGRPRRFYSLTAGGWDALLPPSPVQTVAELPGQDGTIEQALVSNQRQDASETVSARDAPGGAQALRERQHLARTRHVAILP